MSFLVNESPIEEQKICVDCGLCCDGTLFNHAMLKPEESGSLPSKMEENYGSEAGKEYFTLPCPYFCGKCTIYDQKKAIVCSAFRCKVLEDFAENKISHTDAVKRVANALRQRLEIYQLYFSIFGIAYTQSFRQLISELPKLKSESDGDISRKKQVDQLTMKCILYDTLLTKAFKSSKQFESLLEAPTE